jgi:hypothetical protein
MKYLLFILILFTLTFGSCADAVLLQEIAVRNSVEVNNYQVLKDPTFDEMKGFLLSDNVSKNQYINGVYECRHFATDLNNHAEEKGFRCAFVLLCFKTYQHSIVAFNTDRGLIFIEPQTDAAVEPKVGGQYENEEITEILICW